jgi:hypothetical protein
MSASKRVLCGTADCGMRVNPTPQREATNFGSIHKQHFPQCQHVQYSTSAAC